VTHQDRTDAGLPFHSGNVLIAGLAVTETVSWGVLYYAFAIFLTPIKEARGWSTLELTGAFSLALAVSAVAAPIVGRWLDAHSPRVLMTGGSALGALLVYAWSRVQTLAELYLVFAGIGLAMAAVLYESAFIVLTKWFRERRRQAITAVTLVAGAASFVFSPLSERLLSAYGWREALVILALILAAATVPIHALVLRSAPSAPERERPRRARGREFWPLSAAFVIGGFLVAAMSVHLVPLLLRAGHGAAFAAAIAGLVGLAQIPGRLVFLALEQRLRGARLPATVFCLGAFALTVLALDRSTAAAVIFALLFGAGAGMTTLLRPALVVELYGEAAFGANLGATALLALGARAVAPFTAAALSLAPGGYSTMLWLFAAAALLAAAAGARAVS
jgi:cyanate permease